MTVVVVALVGYGLALRRRLLDRRWLAAMLAAEVIALAAFGLYIWFRGFQPLIGMTEKPMDSLFLASSMRSDQMPPPESVVRRAADQLLLPRLSDQRRHRPHG